MLRCASEPHIRPNNGASYRTSREQSRPKGAPVTGCKILEVRSEAGNGGVARLETP